MVAPVGRRGFVGGLAALSAGLWAPRFANAASTIDFDEARHLLSRTSFGATPAEIGALETLDYASAVDRLLAGVRREAITAAPGWLNEGPAELRRQQQAADAQRAEAQRKPGIDGKPLQVTRPIQEQGRETVRAQGCGREDRAFQAVRGIFAQHAARRPRRVSQVVRHVVEMTLDAIGIFQAAQLAQLGGGKAG